METPLERASNKISEFGRFLEKTYLQRREINPHYSLRAFSRSLKISNSALSQIIRGTRPLTAKTAQKLALGLGFSEKDVKELFSTDLLNRRRQIIRKNFRRDLLSVKNFQLLNQWYGDAIIELSRTKNFRQDFQWIGQKLRISAAQVKATVESLLENGLLTQSKGKWQAPTRGTTLGAVKVSNFWLRRYQQEILKRSQWALETVPITDRIHSSLMVSIRKEDVLRAKEIIRRFREEFVPLLSFADNNQESQPQLPEEVYSLAISFFPICTEENPEEKTQK